jgi:methionine biosynthesis protein MetW
MDYEIIADIITPGARVLDLGCGDGELLSLLKQKKNCRGTGIEISPGEVLKCMERGVAVSQGSIDVDLDVYEDKRFDYVILNESLQQVLNIEKVIDDSLRVARKVIVGIPNFCNARARVQIFFMGQVPVTESLPYKWYNTPNLRFLSLKDFRDFCTEKQIRIEMNRCLAGGREVRFLTNLLADVGMFVLARD